MGLLAGNMKRPFHIPSIIFPLPTTRILKAVKMLRGFTGNHIRQVSHQYAQAASGASRLSRCDDSTAIYVSNAELDKITCIMLILIADFPSEIIDGASISQLSKILGDLVHFLIDRCH